MIFTNGLSVNSKNYYHPIILKRLINKLIEVNNKANKTGLINYKDDQYIVNIESSEKLDHNDATMEKDPLMWSHLPTELDYIMEAMNDIAHKQKRFKKDFYKTLNKIIDHDRKGAGMISYRGYMIYLKRMIKNDKKLYKQYHEDYVLDSLVKERARYKKLLN